MACGLQIGGSLGKYYKSGLKLTVHYEVSVIVKLINKMN
jgi:hypothetical protein